ncbi:hypothetical protein [Legionella antarctica]|uniref:hypothetical protein n=1 Tax=Legionella antarctica TaxID=2708020 RepID=UPI0015668F64|nr:hypothetical protein [Legionella antarctica]
MIQPELANWLLQGLAYLGGVLQFDEESRLAINGVKTIWSHISDNPYKDGGSNA